MKILMTGFTPRSCGSTRLLYSYMSNTRVIVKALTQAGHEVVQQAVNVDDMTIQDQFDMALVGIAVPQSLSSRFWFGALWAAERFGPARTRFFVDDWLLHQFQSQLQSGLRNPEKRFFSLPQRHCFEQAKAHLDLWVKWYKFLSKERYELLIPAFPWAKPRVLLPDLNNVQPVIFDPTPLALIDTEIFCGSTEPVRIEPKPMAAREKRWVLAAMREVGPWLDKQRFQWPIVQYGNKRQNQPVVPERELLTDVYPNNVGIIGAPYPKVTAGGGWRARYIHAAATESILFLDPDEGRTAGQPYNLFRTVVEAASDDQLTDIAKQQRDWLTSHTWTMDELVGRLDTHVRPR